MRYHKLSVILALLLIVLLFCSAAGAKEKEPKFEHKNPDVTLEAHEIYSNGTYEELINNSEPDTKYQKTIKFKAKNGSYIKDMNIYAYIDTTVIISEDSETIMQYTKGPVNPKLEIYYGYHQNYTFPWEHYYRVDKCDVICKVVRADFLTRNIWFSDTTETIVDDLIDSEIIPEYGDLP